MSGEDPVLIFLGCVVSFLYVLLARFAHNCLVGRDEQALKMQHLLKRGSKSKRAIQPTSAGSGTSAGLLYSANQSLATIPRSPNRRTPSNQQDHSRQSFRESSRSSATSDDGYTDDILNDDIYRQEMEEQSCLGQLTASRTLMFSDVRCWFFILVVVFSIVNSIGALLGLVLTSGEKKIGHSGRRDQDLLFSFPVLSMYIVMVYLLLTLLYLADKEVAQLETVDGARIRGFAAFGALFTTWAIAFGLVWSSKWSAALEWLSCCIELLLSTLYLAAAFLLPRRILTFGEGTRGVAERIRNVCLVVGVCVFARGVVLLPPTQDELGSLGDYPLPVLDCLSMVPIVASLLLLHQRG